jgi:hypothetical protein
MPANIAHLLICNKAVKTLQDGDAYEEFVKILDSDECKPYLNLGSIGPDLSYYVGRMDQGSGLSNQQVFSKGEIRPQFFFAQTPQIFSFAASRDSAHK